PAPAPAEGKPTHQASPRELFEHLKKTPPPPAGAPPAALAESLAAAHQKLERSYNIAYIAHVPLEPRAAVAEWNDGKLTVWTGTQRPFGVRAELSSQFQVAEADVHVMMPDTGSGYGGKHNGDAALEAAILAKAAGKPVKRNWTREEEMTWAYFRPGGVIEVGAKLHADGTIAEWEFHNYNSGPSGLTSPYSIASKKEQHHPARTPLRQGSYRG